MTPEESGRRPEDDTDAAFRAIVENYGERAVLPDDAPRDRDAPAEPEEPTATGASEPPPADPGPVVSPGLFRLAGEPEPQPAPEHEEHFVPPPPPAFEWPEPRRGLAWVGLVASPVLLVLSVLLGIGLPTIALFGLGVAFVGGFVYLVATMGRGPSEGWDDGARL